MRNSEKKNIKLPRAVGALAAVLVLTLSMSSCGFASYLVAKIPEYYQENEESVVFDESETVSFAAGPAHPETEAQSKAEVVIDKVDPIGDDRLTSAGQAYNTVTEVYYAVADSVVEITTETVQTSIWMGQYVSKGAGSGVIIDESGFIVTNNHVIEGASNVIVRLTDGSEFEATLIGTDAAADIAVIKINPVDKKLTAAPLGSSADLVVGEDVIALGNPLGSLGGTLTTGIISATERSITIDGEEMVLLQTNAAINPGNSGGGLFNMAGQLIGVVNAKASGEDIEGLGFAIPIDFAHTIIEDLINYGYVRGVVDHGLILLDVTEQNLFAAYSKYGIRSTGVVIMESVYTDELKYGDIIASINGEEVTSSADVNMILKRYSVGDTVTVSVMRQGQIVDAKLTLAEKVPSTVTFD